MDGHQVKPLAEGERRREEPQVKPVVQSKQAISMGRRVPFVRLVLFYAVLIGIGMLLIYYLPLFQHAWVGSPVVEGAGSLSKKDALALAIQDRGMQQRTLSVLLITMGALALSLPVAWVYMFTRRLRYDPSLVHTMIILPMVASGIVVIVKDSVALAFSIAGIVAVVRFRNTLKDPKDAVYIFLALGIGLAAGVQALDIAVVLSMMFNFVVLILWRFNVGAMYGDPERDILSIGDPDFMIARTGEQRDAIRWRVSREAADIDSDGILLVHTQNPIGAKERIEVTLSTVAKDWRIVDNFRRRNGVETFAVLLELSDKKGDALSLLSDIDERWAQEIAAAEYVPFRKSAVEDKQDDDEA